MPTYERFKGGIYAADVDSPERLIQELNDDLDELYSNIRLVRCNMALPDMVARIARKIGKLEGYVAREPDDEEMARMSRNADEFSRRLHDSIRRFDRFCTCTRRPRG